MAFTHVGRHLCMQNMDQGEPGHDQDVQGRSTRQIADHAAFHVWIPYQL